MNAILERNEPAVEPKAATPAKKKILIVDDDPAIRRILFRLVEGENYFALTAANGVEALALARTTKFDLALLDLNMPVKDGWETFKQFSTKDPQLPIILITARSNQLFPALASGVDALLEKPLDFVKLFRTIHDLLEETPEARLARVMGRPPAFRFIPPIPHEQELRSKIR